MADIYKQLITIKHIQICFQTCFQLVISLNNQAQVFLIFWRSSPRAFIMARFIVCCCCWASFCWVSRCSLKSRCCLCSSARSSSPRCLTSLSFLLICTEQLGWLSFHGRSRDLLIVVSWFTMSLFCGTLFLFDVVNRAVVENGHGCACCFFKIILLTLLNRSTTKLPSDDKLTNTALPECEITSYRHFSEAIQTRVGIGLTTRWCYIGNLIKAIIEHELAGMRTQTLLSN